MNFGGILKTLQFLFEHTFLLQEGYKLDFSGSPDTP